MSIEFYLSTVIPEPKHADEKSSVVFYLNDATPDCRSVRSFWTNIIPRPFSIRTIQKPTKTKRLNERLDYNRYSSN